MPKKSILICGASGQLGSSLIKIFSENSIYDVYGLSRKFNKDNGFKCDITDYKNLEKVFNKLSRALEEMPPLEDDDAK